MPVPPPKQTSSQMPRNCSQGFVYALRNHAILTSMNTLMHHTATDLLYYAGL